MAGPAGGSRGQPVGPAPGSGAGIGRVEQAVEQGRVDPLAVREPLEGQVQMGEVLGALRPERAELLMLRVKELWTKVAGAPQLTHNEKDRRYFGFVGEALVHYFGPAPSAYVARRPAPLHDDGCGEMAAWNCS